MHVITWDDFCSFFRLTSAYKLIHSDTCSCYEPFLGLYYLKCPSFSSLSSCASYTTNPSPISDDPEPLYLVGPFKNVTLSHCLRWQKTFLCFHLFSQHKSMCFSPISVFSTAPSQPTDSKHLLNETNTKPEQD